MNYHIFSDESGRWNVGNYYIRSWIGITSQNYTLLRKETVFAKSETGVKEIKLEQFYKNYDNFRALFNVDFDIFITISKPSHHQSRSYNIIEAIRTVPVTTGTQALTEKIKTKTINSASNTLFLNYFERFHIENSKRTLLENEEASNFKYIVDTPQYLDREWESIANDCGIQQIEMIKDSSANPGIEIAGIVSSCMMALLDHKTKAQSIYSECIRIKMINMCSTSCPNPNLIFYSDFTPDERTEINRCIPR